MTCNTRILERQRDGLNNIVDVIYYILYLLHIEKLRPRRARPYKQTNNRVGNIPMRTKDFNVKRALLLSF